MNTLSRRNAGDREGHVAARGGTDAVGQGATNVGAVATGRSAATHWDRAARLGRDVGEEGSGTARRGPGGAGIGPPDPGGAGPEEGHRASTFAWWDYVQTIPAPRVIVAHDLDDPRGQGAQWGEVQANIHKALGCVGVVTDGSVRDLGEVRALSVPHEIAPKIPEAVLKVEAAERRIIAACQAADFSAEKLKALYREARPGTY